MEHIDTFNREELAILRALIAEKETADRMRQKAIRARMRGMGFYISDWQTDNSGFTVPDFDDLVARGVIKTAT
jgi:hypothetical protein